MPENLINKGFAGFFGRFCLKIELTRNIQSVVYKCVYNNIYSGFLEKNEFAERIERFKLFIDNMYSWVVVLQH